MRSNQDIVISAMNKGGGSGVGMVRIEYNGPYAAPVTFIGPSKVAYMFSTSPANKYAWVTEEDAARFCQNPEFKRLVVAPVAPQEKGEPFHYPVMDKPQDKPVETPATDKAQAATEARPQTVAEALAQDETLPYDGEVWNPAAKDIIDVVKDEVQKIAKKRGRKPKAH